MADTHQLQASKPGALSHLRAIFLIIVFCVPPFFMSLGSGDPNDSMELLNLVPVREAYRDQHWLMPTLNGAPRLQKPPLATWLPAASATLAGTDSLWILRIPSVLLGILTAVATYGIGCRIFSNPRDPPSRSRSYALLAALFLPVMQLFNRQARLASYDIFAAAFSTGCVYFLVTLVEEVRTTREGERPRSASRWLLWVGLAGVSLGLSLLSKGPAPPATVLVPLFVWMLIFHRRKPVVWSIPTCILVAVAVSVPWVIAVIVQHPEAWQVWQYEVLKISKGQRGVNGPIDVSLHDPWYYYVQVFIWVVPFTPTLIAGLVMPWLPSKSDPQPSESERQGRWLLWMIIIGALLMLSIPWEKKMRYSVQLAPFIALLCAAVWQEFMRSDPKVKIEPAAGMVLWAQALFLIVPAIAGGVAAVWVLVRGTFPKWPVIATVLTSAGPGLTLILCIVLAGVGVVMLRMEYRRRFDASAALLAAGAWVFVMTVLFVYRAAPQVAINPTREPVEKALRQVAGQPIYTLAHERPPVQTLYFVNHLLPVEEPSDIARIAREHPGDTLYLMLMLTNPGPTSHDTDAIETALRLATIEKESGRHFEEVSHWLDDARRTALLKLPPAAAATQ